MPSVFGIRQISGVPYIVKPDSAFGSKLLQVVATIGRVQKRNLIAAVRVRPRTTGADFVGAELIRLTVALRLTESADHIDIELFCFDHGHRHQTDKQHIVCATTPLDLPLGNGQVVPFHRATAEPVPELA